MKKLIAILMVLTMVFALAGCNSKKEESVTLKVVTTSDKYVPLFEKFTKDTGTKVEFLSMSSGEVLSKVKAEGGAPMADVWFGGGIDAFMAANSEELLEPVDKDFKDTIAKEFKAENNTWFAKGITIVGFIVNNDILKEKNLEAPKTWDDLTNPIYKDEVLMSNPAVSGTNYAVVNALLQLKGEAGWDYFSKLNENIEYYGKRGKDPQLKTVAGEVAIGITYIDGTITKLEDEQNVTIIYPEAIPYIPEGVAVFKGAQNVEAAKDFMEWLFGNDENLSMMAQIDQKDFIKVIKPEMKGIEISFDGNDLIEEDLTKFGSEREAILAKWAEIVGEKGNVE